MRIIGGKYKGRLLKGKIYEVRPTTDFAKESLFNILNNYYDFSVIEVLDLFSGTGSISFEFASRGCQHIDIVESNYRHYQFICHNISNFGFKGIYPIKIDAFSFLNKCNRQYDIIFADPPYEMENIKLLPEIIIKNNFIKKGGMFILEHSKNHNFNNHKNFWQERKYGAVHFSFFLP